VWSSELAKLVANSMLAQRISSINSISAICEATGARIEEVSTSVGSDPRIGNKFLRAGIGFGGSCFKKDVLSLVYLAESLGLDEVGQYWRQVVDMNEYQRNRFTRRVIKCLNNTLVGKKITILGFAFKKNTSDTREAPAFEIIKVLMDEGPREIAVFDPCCNPIVIKEEIRNLHGAGALTSDGGPVEVYADPYEACAASNAILIVTEFDEFRNSPKSTPSPTKPTSQSTSTSPNPPISLSPTEPSCASDCPDCQAEEANDQPTGLVGEYKPQEPLDWSQIAYRMRKPKWVFDGRCIIDGQEMAKLGVRVESIGSPSMGV
jgi:UDPglucose 6-dehydrogenase